MLSKFLSDHSTSPPPFPTTRSGEFHRRCHPYSGNEQEFKPALVVIWPRREDAVGCGNKESSMSKAGLDNRHRNKDGEISGKHGNTLIRTLRKIYGQSFAAGYPETEKLSEVLLKLNETSLSQLRRDHETGHLEHKIANASK
jgi:hypothetical protein